MVGEAGENPARSRHCKVDYEFQITNYEIEECSLHS
jgi:hypothetical protein